MRPETEPDTERDTDRGLEWRVAEDTGAWAKVLIHNDDVTPMDFVVYILRTVFGLSYGLAESVMLTAHLTGVAYVVTLSHEEAKYRVGKAHGLARAAGYPLTFTIEPEG